MPSATDSFFYNYEMLIASKMINGRVPTFVGEFKGNESKEVNIPVN